MFCAKLERILYGLGNGLHNQTQALRRRASPARFAVSEPQLLLPAAAVRPLYRYGYTAVRARLCVRLYVYLYLLYRSCFIACIMCAFK